MRKQLRSPNVETVGGAWYCTVCHSAPVAESILETLDSCLRRNDKLPVGNEQIN